MREEVHYLSPLLRPQGQECPHPWDFLDRFDKAARISKWTTDERKINEFISLFLDDAYDWYKGLKDFPGLDLTKWNNVKEVILRDYEKKFKAKTICASFRECQQKQHKTIRDSGQRSLASSASCMKLQQTRWEASRPT